jgi:hypothetical protein
MGLGTDDDVEQEQYHADAEALGVAFEKAGSLHPLTREQGVVRIKGIVTRNPDLPGLKERLQAFAMGMLQEQVLLRALCAIGSSR